MTEADGGTQESRSETVAARVTPTEKKAIRFVADGYGKSESDVLREMTLEDTVAEYRRMKEVLGVA